LFALTSNVFVVTYLIAMLMTIYKEMLHEGEFAYKYYVNDYVSSIEWVMKDESGLYLMLINPPPLNLFTIFLVFFANKKRKLKKAAKFMSSLIFWVENVFLIFFFFLFQLFVLGPKVYLKMMSDIGKIQKKGGYWKNLALWISAGGFITLWFSIKDARNFYRILLLAGDSNGNQQKRGAREKKMEALKQMRIRI